MTAMLPSEAAETLCPFSRTFGLPTASPVCRGPDCALWRWQPIMADHPAFVAAMAQHKAEAPHVPHPVRVKHIMENRERYGIPTKPERGFCGAGGQP